MIGVNASIFEPDGFKDRFERHATEGDITGLIRCVLKVFFRLTYLRYKIRAALGLGCTSPIVWIKDCVWNPERPRYKVTQEVFPLRQKEVKQDNGIKNMFPFRGHPTP